MNENGIFSGVHGGWSFYKDDSGVFLRVWFHVLGVWGLRMGAGEDLIFQKVNPAAIPASLQNVQLNSFRGTCYKFVAGRLNLQLVEMSGYCVRASYPRVRKRKFNEFNSNES